MQKICFFLVFSMILSSCLKSTAPSNIPCSNDGGTIVGHWALTAKRSYTIPAKADTNWQSVNNGNVVTIKFSADSVFSYNTNYSYGVENYNRFTVSDSLNFRIYSTSPPAITGPHYPSALVKMISASEIELIYPGVDAGQEEYYVYICIN